MLFRSLTYAAIRVGSDTVVQSVIADRIRGRVFSVYDIVMNTSLVVGLCAAASSLPQQSLGLLVCGLLITAAAAHYARSERRLTDAERLAISAAR